MDMIRLAHEALASIARSPKLFVACVAGHALGGGLEIALACDVRYAIEGRYRLGTPEVTLGLLPGNGGTQRLPRLIGAGPALELLAHRAHGLPRGGAGGSGSVSQVFADQAAFDAHVEGLRALPPLSLANIKRAVFEGMEKPLADGLALERDLMEELFRSNDAREGSPRSARSAPRSSRAHEHRDDHHLRRRVRRRRRARQRRRPAARSPTPAPARCSPRCPAAPRRTSTPR